MKKYLKFKYNDKFYNYKLILFTIFILISYFTNSHVNFFFVNSDFQSYFRIFQATILLILIFSFKDKIYYFYKRYIKLNFFKEIKIEYIILFSLPLLFLISSLVQLDLRRSIGWIGTMLGVAIIMLVDIKFIIFLLKKYIQIILILIIIFFILFIISLIGNIDFYGNSNGLLGGLFNFGSKSRLIGNIYFYRFGYHLQQPALISAYILFPFCILSLIEKQNKKTILFILTSCLISFSGTIVMIYYFAIIFFLNSYTIKIGLSKIFLLSLSFLLFLSISLKGYTLDYDLENSAYLRLGSGVERLHILFEQINYFFDYYFFGINSYSEFNSYPYIPNRFLQSSFFFSTGIRGGFVAFVLSVILFLIIFSKINQLLINTNLNFLMINIMIAFLFISIFFQDFGLNSNLGFFSLTFMIRIINENLLNYRKSRLHRS
jgi:hypothetical protein